MSANFANRPRPRSPPELLLLHALPLDGSMWAEQMHLLPGATHAPTLYSSGETIDVWARAALEPLTGGNIIVVGCSVSGSCALEIATIAPERVSALVLIGTKAKHHPDPTFHASALRLIGEEGLEVAWESYWAPLFSRATSAATINRAKEMALRSSAAEIARGVTVFHTRPSRDHCLTTFPGPITIVSGADDVAPGPRASTSQAASTVNGRVHVLPACGHYVPLERPLALNAILRDVIASQDRA
ncbi:alpha/beta hydrolase [Ensifer sp. PDNC004]|uniref:alpha/beta fold hydrolase n=1 Tax=Ensifer sp. PDNC004 TaxID=2811423 RepID=UPI001965E710|nr:alpha/beta hydrolase [Ensifer sp. PDNC004]QRY67063.1 alpha/beta hydrolase [Ensifer sp. PDNC004]